MRCEQIMSFKICFIVNVPTKRLLKKCLSEICDAKDQWVMALPLGQLANTSGWRVKTLSFTTA